MRAPGEQPAKCCSQCQVYPVGTVRSPLHSGRHWGDRPSQTHASTPHTSATWSSRGHCPIQPHAHLGRCSKSSLNWLASWCLNPTEILGLSHPSSSSSVSVFVSFKPWFWGILEYNQAHDRRSTSMRKVQWVLYPKASVAFSCSLPWVALWGNPATVREHASSATERSLW